MKEHRDIVSRWAERTLEKLTLEIDRKKVIDTTSLRSSLQARISEGGNVITAEISFLVRGRFVDMGAGRKAKILALSKRKPKKWYSPTIYRRLNVIQGALGLQMMEDSLEQIKNAIENGSKD
jgi:hypothetical protein